MRDMNDRTCIVTRKALTADAMIRFVAAPDQSVVADLKRNLPGRGCWVSAQHEIVSLAVKRNSFAHALGEKVTPMPDLADFITQLMKKNFSGALGLVRKSGKIVLGATKVDLAIRNREAILVLHASDGAIDGVRKLDQARKAVEMTGGSVIPAFKLLSCDEMDFALGGANMVHVALLKGYAGENLAKKALALVRYQGLQEEERQAYDDSDAAKEVQ
jgi:uncharacterized protein